MNKITLMVLSAFLIGTTQTKADDDRYIYLIDLTKVENDQLMVTLIPPATKEKELVFYMPKIIPGTYKEANYGKYVSNLTVYDKKGNNLPVERFGDNSWKISRANKMVKLTYWVEDTYDSEVQNMIYPMAGTNIEEGENFILNTPGFFGYFEGMKDYPFDMKIIRPKDFYGGTGLIPVDNPELSASIRRELELAGDNSIVDHYTTDNYNHLVDSPIMYSNPDTTVVDVAGTEILIAVYSPGKQVHSKYLSENLEELLYAQKDYLGGQLPVDKYAFLFYFESGKHNPSGYGALEHSYSSLYYLPDYDQEAILQPIRDAAAHEFFHIITPLTIHSEEIQNFDFNEPDMSEHLWLYEGMTEYAASHVQVKYNILTLDEYLKELSSKMRLASNNFNDTLSFTDLSKYTLDQYPDQYQNVYYKGALIGMCLDIMLRDLSDGKYGTQKMMEDLSKSYGKDQAFRDDELFDKIASLTYPEIGEFLNHYVREGDVLPYKQVFEKVGIDYIESLETEEFSLGRIGLGVDENTGKLVVDNTSRMNEFGKSVGYQSGDILLQFNGKDLPGLGQVHYFLDSIRTEMKAGDTLTVTVSRQNETGEFEEQLLKSDVFKVKTSEQHILNLEPAPSDRQRMIFDAWIKPGE